MIVLRHFLKAEVLDELIDCRGTAAGLRGLKVDVDAQSVGSFPGRSFSGKLNHCADDVFRYRLPPLGRSSYHRKSQTSGVLTRLARCKLPC
jgi:hypothetical protein